MKQISTLKYGTLQIAQNSLVHKYVLDKITACDDTVYEVRRSYGGELVVVVVNQ